MTWESRLVETKEAVDTLTVALSIFSVTAAEALAAADELARVAGKFRVAVPGRRRRA